MQSSRDALGSAKVEGSHTESLRARGLVPESAVILLILAKRTIDLESWKEHAVPMRSSLCENASVVSEP